MAQVVSAHVPHSLTDALLVPYQHNHSVQLRFGHTTSAWTAYNRGLKQGDPSAPHLWNAILSSILEPLLVEVQ
eukprot:11836452-Prorocentrum_lima.AAC.1